MCGLLGYFSNKEYSFKVENFNNNLSLLERRGPDYKDFYQYNYLAFQEQKFLMV